MLLTFHTLTIKGWNFSLNLAAADHVLLRQWKGLINNCYLYFVDHLALHAQVAGFVQHYQGLSFATVKGAGHMVGQAKPAEALSLIDRFLRQESY